jgi:TP901 family phage tail tape measure protein
MAIGAHELLLIVRAQNQASALLGRVGRDFRRLQAMKSLDIQRSRQVNQLARNALQQQAQMAKIQSVMSENGKIRIRHEIAISRNLLHQQNIENRISNLEIRRTAIARAGSNLEIQRLRLQRQQLGVESKLAAIEAKRIALNNQLGVIGTRMMRNQLQQQAISERGSRGLGLQAQLLERELALRKATSAYMKAVRDPAGGPVGGTAVDTRKRIAELRVAQTKAAMSELAGQQKILQSTMQTLRGTVVENQQAFDRLALAERDLASETRILKERERGLQIQLQNLDARTAAVAATEAELNSQLAITRTELKAVNAAWVEQAAAVRAAEASLAGYIAEEQILNAQLAETNALIAAQGAERMGTLARTVSHVGRVLTATGLIGTAAFAAMGIAAAHFNTQAVNVATQTGNINQSAQAVVANAEKIQHAVLDTMQTIPASSTELNDALYNIYSSMQVTFGGGAKLLKLFGEVWVAGGMRGSIEDVSNALITLANNWEISGDDMQGFQKLSASTLATVRFGRLTVEQYTQTMNQLAPAFHGAHQSIEQMNGSLAFLSRLLPSTGVTAAGIARMMEQLQRFAAAPKGGFENLAKEIQDSSGNLKPLDQVLEILIKRMPQLAKSGVTLTNFFKTVSGNQGTIQARRALQGFILQFPEYRRILKATSGDQNEFKRSLKAMQDSPGVKWATFMSQMHALALELGTAVIPMLLEATRPLKALAHWFNELSDEQKKNYGHWAALVAIGTLVAGVVATVAGGLALFIMSMRTLASVLGKGKGIGPELRIIGQEAGFINTKFALISASLIILIPLLKVFGVDAGKAATNTHNLRIELKLLEFFLTALSVKWGLTKLGFFASNLRLAASGAALLRLRLLRLGAIGIVTVGVNLLINGNRYNKNDQWNWKGIKEALNPLNFGRDIQAALGGKDARPGMQPVAAATLPKKTQKLISNNIKTMFINANAQVGTGTKSIENKVREMYKNLGEKDKPLLDKWIAQGKHAAQEWNKTIHNLGSGIEVPRKDLFKSLQPMSNAEFLASIRQAYKLKQVLDKAPNLEAAKVAWVNYTKFIARITKDFTKEQKKEFDDLFGMMDQFGTESATHTQAQITAMVAHINKLQKIFAKHPTLALSAQISKAQKALADAQFGDQASIAENYYSALDALEKSHTSTADKEAKKRKKIIDDEFKKQLKRQQDAQSTMKSVTSNLMQISQAAFQQYQSDLGTIFQGPWMTGSIMGRRQQFGFSARPEDLLTDMRMSVQHAEKFQGSLERLRKRGAPDELVSQIRQLGPEAQKQLDTLLQQKPEVFAKYVKWFKRGQHDAQVAAQRDLQAELKKWRAHGRAVALAIAAGLRDENVALQMSLSKMVARMFPGTHALATTRPTRRGARIATHGGTKPTTTVHNHHTTNYNIHPSQKGESWQSMLRRANFQHRNKRIGP